MRKKWYGNKFRLGVLGGGQLGRMMIQEAVNLDVEIHCLDPDQEAPCKDLATSFQIGSLQDYDEVMRFGSDKDLLTIEIEHVNVEALEALEKRGIPVFPQPGILRMIQDKGLQKEFYAAHGFPTAPFRLIQNKSQINENISFPVVQKLRTGGYDGKGVVILNGPNDLKNAFDQESVLEEKIPFEKELSVIVARNQRGECASYPVVECEFNPESNLVEFLFSPARISNSVEREAKSLAEKLIQQLNMVGLLAVEFFLTSSGELLINEIAPRPHNSGHHTIECNSCSQFEQHLRSILNLPLGDTKAIQAGVMVNIIGAEGYQGEPYYDGLEEVLSMPGVKPHIYGKKQTKPHRKMGHATIHHDDLDSAIKIATEVQKRLQVKSV
ncbi:MAG: 5-(carboxyamino)imidazole ribonucleotide synthase [Bacteroidetes bacterium]|nr:MAG: 5-(carboxyamino)imidazole ribonucleotide synthase [Bacteroidota bacterium]